MLSDVTVWQIIKTDIIIISVITLKLKLSSSQVLADNPAYTEGVRSAGGDKKGKSTGTIKLNTFE